MEPLLFLAALGIGCWSLLRGATRRSRWIAAGSLVLAAGAWALWEPGGDRELASALPSAATEADYVTSAACRSCHPDQYDSWRRSYHRTMTRPATPATVLAAFDDVVLEDRGYTFRLERRGDEFWIEMPDPLWFMEPAWEMASDPPRIEARVVMTTGSHHMQYYWIRRPADGDVYRRHDDGSLIHLPWVWLIDEERWVPSQDSFLRPPTSLVEAPLRWNTVCSACHSVGTRPRASDSGRRFDTRTVELGIACEACHGPGGRHVRVNRSPVRRYVRHLAGDDPYDSTIVEPTRLDKQRSADVCGSCHSFSRPLDPRGYRRRGIDFRPGDSLSRSMRVFRFTTDPRHPLLRDLLETEPNALESRFWSDGTIRVAGREYNGLIESPCFQRGQMTCQSCHSMHDYRRPADQLASANGGDRACLTCHESLRDSVELHSRHPSGSSGSSCMNCHMPRTTYGLLEAIRSHRITSPSAGVSVETDRPNACNLCHLDRTLAWTARRLSDWYDQPTPTLTPLRDSVAASVLWGLEGDAAQRAITAWHMGWGPAQEASGRDWLAPYLAQLLRDPYAVNRQIAYQSLRSLPGFEGFEFDYLGSSDARRAGAREAMVRWRRSTRGSLDRSGPRLLIDARGRIDLAAYVRILERRDDSPLRISE